MIGLGGLLHGELGWLFFALIAGHVAMAILHPLLIGDRVMRRMGVGARPSA